MNAEEAQKELARLLLLGDKEIAHDLRDKILIKFLRSVAPEVAGMAQQVEDEVGFWYA